MPVEYGLTMHQLFLNTLICNVASSARLLTIQSALPRPFPNTSLQGQHTYQAPNSNARMGQQFYVLGSNAQLLGVAAGPAGEVKISHKHDALDSTNAAPVTLECKLSLPPWTEVRVRDI